MKERFVDVRGGSLKESVEELLFDTKEATN